MIISEPLLADIMHASEEQGRLREKLRMLTDMQRVIPSQDGQELLDKYQEELHLLSMRKVKLLKECYAND